MANMRRNILSRLLRTTYGGIRTFTSFTKHSLERYNPRGF